MINLDRILREEKVGKENWGPDVQRLVVNSVKLACKNGHDVMGLEYLLMILVRDTAGLLQRTMRQNHYDFFVLQELFLQYRPARENVVLTHQQVKKTDHFWRALLNEANNARHRLHQPHLEIDHVVIGILKTRSVLSDELLRKAGITEQQWPEIAAKVEADAETRYLEVLFAASPSTP